MMAVFFFIAHEKGFKFHAQPQTGAYSCFHLKASAEIVLINIIPYKINWVCCVDKCTFLLLSSLPHDASKRGLLFS